MSLDRALKSSNWRARTDAQQISRDRQRVMRHSDNGQGTSSCEPMSSNRIYIGNMPYTAQRRDVERLFEGKNLQMQVSHWSTLSNLVLMIQQEEYRHLDRSIYISQSLILLRQYVDHPRCEPGYANALREAVPRSPRKYAHAIRTGPMMGDNSPVAWHRTAGKAHPRTLGAARRDIHWKHHG
jgi:hypothetical protein